jgi:putative DNA primase/helicase
MSEALLDVGKIVDTIAGESTPHDEEKAEKPKKEKRVQGKALSFNDPAPSALPQNGILLLDDIARQVRRFLVVDSTSIDAIALWIVFAHLAQKAFLCPNLCFNSATKACGKSTALDIVARLVPKAIPTSNISPAALFRAIEAFTPTLVIDEADSMFRNNDDLRTILNSGFSRLAAYVIRTVGDDFEARTFNVFCPKVIALIGNLPDTLASRSIIVKMRRRKPDEAIQRLRSDIDQGFGELKSRIVRFALDYGEKILALDPEIPSSLSDRQADCWRELLRIADFVGGAWPKKARVAALELCSKDDDSSDNSIRLLADIQTIFAEEPERSKWPSETLVDALKNIEESPWEEYGYGKGLTTNRLAKMLSRFDIHTRTLRSGTSTPKGYTVESFTDAFARYLPQHRNTATNDTNDIQNNDLKCCGNVAVADAKRNSPEKDRQGTGGGQHDNLA